MRMFRSEKERHRYYSRLTEEQKYEAAGEMLAEAEHVVFLGGAGVSTESGIPDFRSRNGLYHQKSGRRRRHRPEYYLSSVCLNREPEEFFRYYRKNLDVRRAEPNTAHRILAAMEASGRLDGVVTQNIDGLHQKAGSRNVLEIHGTIMRNYCVSCGRTYGPDFIFDSPDPVPRCPACGKMVRPDVTLYGEFLPEQTYCRAIDLVGSADCLIIGGTSLAVGSASELAHLYHGGSLIMINKGPTKMEGAADLVFRDSIGKVLGKITGSEF